MPIQFLRTPGIENQGDACYNDWRIASRRFSGKSPLGLDFSTSSVLTTLVVGTGSVTIRAPIALMVYLGGYWLSNGSLS